ncbi:WbqC family protein [Daejeonella lutea]|uniref:WbqC-like protein family protein n=1 Tax=Daejeonella lutea TaxID=572036 RepID=A0A1T5AH55_9SPHI|nr:WbqC family protein [Daejeonella lutea]SKB34276.1 WbqC-like protein family protein [Daejeonella lutea]
MVKGAIFPLFYLPPIDYFSKLQENRNQVVIENAEHFEKQSFRNRASIHSPNGKLDLIVPVIKGSKNHTKVKDVKISYDFNWQRLHLLSLQTSYRSSAYFEFYEDDLMPFYEKRWDFLFDYNEDLLALLLRFLKLNIQYEYTNNFEKEHFASPDFRSSIHPKRSILNDGRPYFQVFEERNGFIPNLSIVDLLFNQGPQSNKYL